MLLATVGILRKLAPLRVCSSYHFQHRRNIFLQSVFRMAMKQSKISSFFVKRSTPDEDGSPVKQETKSKIDIKSNGTKKSAISKLNTPTKEKETEDTRKRKSESTCDSPEVAKVKSTNKKAKRAIIYSDSEESDSEWKPFNPEEAVDSRRSKSDEEAGSNYSSPGKKSEDEKDQKVPEKTPSPVASKKATPVRKTSAKKSLNKVVAKKEPVKKKETKKAIESDEEKEVKESEEGKKEEEPKEQQPKSTESPSKDEKQKKSSVAIVNPFTRAAPTAAGAVKGWNNDYDPSVSNYHPINDASWTRGQSVPYLALARTLEKIEEISSRLKIIDTLANYLRSVILLSPHDLKPSLYLCLNKLAPAYEGVELGIAETNLMKAISQATGRPLSKIKEDVASRGDLGLVAEASRSNQKTLFQPSPLSVSGVFAKLKEIAAMTGQASLQKKISMIQSMLVACKHAEARYLVRSLAGKLRIGLAEQSLLQALAQACFLTPPNQNQADDSIEWPPKAKLINGGKGLSAEDIKSKVEKVAFVLKSCYCECPNYDKLVEVLLEHGIDGLEEHCQLTPGIPPRPMLAQPTRGVEDVLQRFTGIAFTCEYKYDGERAQIHLLENGDIKIFSRNQEDNTLKYPDVVGRFKECVGPDVKSCIVDSEVVAWDREKECILPFQVLSTRKRKDAVEADIKVQVLIFAFDLIYLNGQSLVKEPLSKRRELLREHFKDVKGQFGFATSLDTDCMEQVHEFLEESIKGNCEGLMVKTLHENASYELAKRSQKWLKLKKDYLATGGDSLDLVVIGGFLGKGKRTGVYGGYLLACYDPDNEEFQTICKIGTGFSDEQLEKHAETLKQHMIPKPKPYYRFHSNLTPDHWFEAVVVWEVKCADLSLSPVHTAAMGIEDAGRGISLRFPRFLRLREDKNAEDATSASQVAQMYKNQDVVKNSNSGVTIEELEDDFY